MSCSTYRELQFQQRAAWDRYRIHAYREMKLFRKVGDEQADKIASLANTQRHFLATKMAEHKKQCPKCSSDTAPAQGLLDV